jgi:hypothetical protein
VRCQRRALNRSTSTPLLVSAMRTGVISRAWRSGTVLSFVVLGLLLGVSPIHAGAQVTAGTIVPATGDVADQPFTLTYSNAGGVNGFTLLGVLFHTTESSYVNACYVGIDPTGPTPHVALLNDAGSGSAVASLGDQGAVQNSSCAVILGGQTKLEQISPTTLQLTLSMHFFPTFAGIKTIYMSASATGVSPTGWQDRGTWTVPSLPLSANGVTPSSGAGSKQQFTLTYGHTDGAAEITDVSVLFHTNPSVLANSCYLGWNRSQGRIALLNDAGTSAPSAPLLSGTTLSNSQCAVTLDADTAVTETDDTLTFKVTVNFAPGFAGLKTVYLQANSGSQTTNLQARGAWTVPTALISSNGVSLYAPSADAIGVLVNSSISIVFFQPMTAGTITASTVVLKDDLTQVVAPANVAYSSATRTVTLTPSTVLAGLTTYRVTVSGGAAGVRDATMTPMTTDATWTFRTGPSLSAPQLMYGFDEGSGTTTADASGNDRTATLQYGVGWTSAGKAGTALLFDGNDDAVEIPSSPPVALTTAFTLEAWVYPTTSVPSGVLIHRLTDAGTDQYLLCLYEGRLLLLARTQNGAMYAVSAGVLPANQWSYVAGTWDGTTLRTYINGALDGTQALSGSLLESRQPLRLGWSDGFAFTGRLDDVRVYHRALPQAEIGIDSTTPVVDSTSPLVVGHTPAATAVGVPLTTTVTSTFSKGMAPSTVTASTVLLRNEATDVTVAATVTYNASLRVATLTPANPLAPLTAYRATVLGGVSGVLDAGGLTLPSSVTWTFRTRPDVSVVQLAYPFNEGFGDTTADVSGNGLPAALVNGTTWTASGKYGAALVLDGIDDTAEVPSVAALDLTGAFTLEAWVYPNASAASGALISRRTDTSAAQYVLALFEGHLSVLATTNSGSASALTAATVPGGQWTHVAATWDGTTLRTYINGVLDGSTPLSGSLSVSTQPLRFGWLEGLALAGRLDEVRLYSRALSSADIGVDLATAVSNNTAPQVFARSPAGGDVGVPSAAVVSVTFTKAMSTGSITTATLLLRDDTTLASIPGTVSYDASTRVATLTPATLLTPLTTYRVTVKGGAGGVLDFGGVQMVASDTWTFRTAPAGIVPALMYPFSEGLGTTTADVSGNDLTASLGNGVAWTALGKYGSGLVFDGNDDVVTVSASPALNLATAFTLEAWVYPTTSPASSVIIHRLADGGQNQYALALLESKLMVLGRSATGEFRAFSTSTIPSGQWTHLAGTWDGTTLRAYVNGTQEGTASLSGTLLTSSQPLRLGWTPGGGFTGRLDEVRLYGRAISAPELAVDIATQMSLFDSFDDNALDYSKWTPATLLTSAVDPSIAIVEANHRLELGPLVAGQTGIHHQGVTSTRAWAFRDSYAQVTLTANQSQVSAPSSAPSLALVHGTGLSTGTYQYLVVYETTDRSLSLASPSATKATTGPVASPPPTSASATTMGGNLVTGATYRYKVTYCDGTFETAPSAATNSVTVSNSRGNKLSRQELGWVPPPGVGNWCIYRTKANGSTYYLIPAALLSDDSGYLYDVIATDAMLLNIQPPSPGTMFNNRIDLSGIPTSPSPLVTKRRIYRTAANGSVYKLAFTIYDNTSTTSTDQTPDSSLGSTLPTQTTGDQSEASFGLVSDANNFYRVFKRGTQLICERKLADVVQQSCTGTYDPVAHRILRIRHSGASLLYEASSDATTWTVLFSEVWDEARVPLSALWFELKTGTIGAELSSSITYFDEFDSGRGTGNPKPTISLTSPASGASFTTGASITVTATASDADGIANVEFFADDQSVGKSAVAPYSMAWSTSANGAHRLVAVAKDNRGGTAVSAPVDITVAPPIDCSTLTIPVPSPLAGTFLDSVIVSLSTTTSGGIVRYTINGADPSASSLVYSSALVLTTTSTVRARTFLGSCSPSALLTATYTVTSSCGTVAAPTFTPSPGSYTDSVSVALSTTTSSGIIRYTVDGSATTSSSPIYGSALTLTSTTTVRAQTYLGSCTPSAEVSGLFQVTPAATTVAPIFSPPAGAYAPGTAISLSVADPSAVIRYTTDGSEPTASSPVYSSSFTLTVPLTLKAKAFRSGFAPSATVSASYAPMLAAPALTPGPGVHAFEALISAFQPDPVARIVYTTDGSDPLPTSPTLSGSLALTAPQTLKFRTIDSGGRGYAPSIVVGGLYTPTLPTPTLGPPTGAYPYAQLVWATPGNCGGCGQQFRYTLDGSAVTSTSPLFFGDSVPLGSTIRVRAYLAGWQESAEAVESYWRDQILQSAGTASPSNVSTTTSNALGQPLTFTLSGGVFAADSMQVFNNGIQVPISFTDSNHVTVPADTLKNGRNRLELFGEDSSGAVIETTATLWAGTNSLRIRATDSTGGEFSSSSFLATVAIEASPGVELSSVVDGQPGRVFINVPSSTELTVIVSVPGYRTETVPLFSSWSGQFVLSVRLEIDNDDFHQGLAGWSPTNDFGGRNVGIIAHSEASTPIVPCSDCVPRGTALTGSFAGFLAEGSLSALVAVANNDLSVDSHNRWGTVLASRTFVVPANTRKVSVRYRIQSAELWNPSIPWRDDAFDIRVISSGGVAASVHETITSLRPTFDFNYATGWRILSANVTPGDTVTITVAVTNTFDNAGDSWINADYVLGEALTVPKFELFDYSGGAATSRMEELQFLSVDSSMPSALYGGRGVLINGSLAITGASDDTITSVELEILPANTDAVVAFGTLSPAAATALLRPFATAGNNTLSVTAQQNVIDQWLFQIPASQFAGLSTAVTSFNLRVRVRTARGLNEVVWLGTKASTPANFQKKPLPRLTWSQLPSGGSAISPIDGRDHGNLTLPTPSRYRDQNSRDYDLCVVGPGDPVQKCGGDGWALPATHQFLSGTALSTFRYNDFSNQNGGYFPIHGSHREGKDIDVFSADYFSYTRRDAAVANELLRLLRDPVSGPQIENIWVTFTASRNQAFHNTLLGQTVPSGSGGQRSALSVIRNVPGHVDHFHIRLR